jgi:hypothetical protein
MEGFFVAHFIAHFLIDNQIVIVNLQEIVAHFFECFCSLFVKKR